MRRKYKREYAEFVRDQIEDYEFLIEEEEKKGKRKDFRFIKFLKDTLEIYKPKLTLLTGSEEKHG